MKFIHRGHRDTKRPLDIFLITVIFFILITWYVSSIRPKEAIEADTLSSMVGDHTEMLGGW